MIDENGDDDNATSASEIETKKLNKQKPRLIVVQQEQQENKDI